MNGDADNLCEVLLLMIAYSYQNGTMKISIMKLPTDPLRRDLHHNAGGQVRQTNGAQIHFVPTSSGVLKI
jgi:hypothetical protein